MMSQGGSIEAIAPKKSDINYQKPKIGLLPSTGERSLANSHNE